MSEGQKKYWYKKAWGKVIAIISVLATCAGMIEGGYLVYSFYDDYKKLQKTVQTLDKGYDSFEIRLSHVEEFINRQKKSYAVGFRVVNKIDPQTGKKNQTKIYRDWSGEEHMIYYDQELSERDDFDYYFWIDKEGEIIYCW